MILVPCTGVVVVRRARSEEYLYEESTVYEYQVQGTIVPVNPPPLGHKNCTHHEHTGFACAQSSYSDSGDCLLSTIFLLERQLRLMYSVQVLNMICLV